MKRSEMIREVANEIKPILNNSSTFNAGLTSFGAEHIVDLILKSFERQGMTPPCVDTIWDGGFGDKCTKDHVSDCKWENE